MNESSSESFFRGTASADGIVFYTRSETTLFAGDERGGPLAFWQSGCRIYRYGDFVLLAFAESRRLRASDWTGFLAVARDGAWTTGPQLAAGAAPGDVCLHYHGQTRHLAASLRQEIFANDILDLSQLRFHETVSLDEGEEVQSPIRVEPAPISSLAEAIGITPPTASLADEIQQQAHNKALLVARAIAIAVTAPLASLSSVLGKYSPATSAGIGTSRAASSPHTLQAANTPAQRSPLWNRIARWLNRLTAPLRRLSHSKALQELFNNLDAQDYDEALRRALPLNKESSPNRQQALASLVVRPQDEITFKRRAGLQTPSVGLHAEIFLELGRRYEAMAEAFLSRGEILKAAYVLAELLLDTHRALDLLEEHGLFDSAADLAEKKELAIDIAIRYHLMARNIERAMTLAIRHQAFAVAVRHPRLKESERELLFLHWADHLAVTGRFAEAATVLFNNMGEDRRPNDLCQWFVQCAIDMDEETGRMHALWARLRPTEAEQIASSLRRGRRDIAVFLNTLQADNATRQLQREMLFVADTEEGSALEEAHVDAVRFADLPPRVQVKSLRAEPSAHLEAFRASSSDTPILDAVRVAGQRHLVAMGTLGVLLVNRSGRVLHRFDTPATRLVVSDNGVLAIALDTTGNRTRLSRLNLHRKESEYWTTTNPLEAWSSTFDGDTWLASDGSALFVVEAQRAGFVCRQDFSFDPEIHGSVTAICRTATGVEVLLHPLVVNESDIRLRGIATFERIPLRLHKTHQVPVSDRALWKFLDIFDTNLPDHQYCCGLGSHDFVQAMPAPLDEDEASEGDGFLLVRYTAADGQLSRSWDVPVPFGTRVRTYRNTLTLFAGNTLRSISADGDTTDEFTIELY